MALLDSTTGTGRLLFAILAGAGLRIGEALSLRWQHVDLGTGTLYVVDSKTDQGVREVHLTPALREELTLARAEDDSKPTDFVIATSTGHKHNPSNLRRDILVPVRRGCKCKARRDWYRANRASHLPLASPHLCVAALRIGDDVRYTADQLGHEDPRFTLRVYTQATKRRDRLSGPHLKAFDRALEWAQMGASEPLTVPAFGRKATKNPA